MKNKTLYKSMDLLPVHVAKQFYPKCILFVVFPVAFGEEVRRKCIVPHDCTRVINIGLYMGDHIFLGYTWRKLPYFTIRKLS